MDKISIDNSNKTPDVVTDDVAESYENENMDIEVENSVDDVDDEASVEESSVNEENVIVTDDKTDKDVIDFELKMEQVRNRRTTKKKRINIKKLIVSAIIIVIIAIVTFAAYKGLYFLGTVLSDEQQMVAKSEEISITSTGTLDYERYGDGMLVANSGVISFLNSKLETVWEKQGFEGIPVISQNGKYALITYTDTANAALVYNNNLMPIECSGKIVSSYINKNGYFAIITTEDGFKNQIVVYDNSANVFYKWHSSENYVTGVAISPDNKSMCATTIGFTENGFDSGILMFDFGQGNPVSGQHQSDNLIMKIDNVGNKKIVAIGEKCTSFYKSNGNKISDVSYGDKKLVTFDVTDSEKLILCFSDDDSATSKSEVASYSSKGKFIGKLDTTGRILSVSSCKDRVMISKDGYLEMLSDKCKRVKNVSVVRDLKNSVLFDGGKYAFVISGNLAQVLKIG